MRIKKLENLPKDKQIERLKFRIKFLLLFSIIWSIFIIIISSLIFILTLEYKFGIALLITIPFSVYFGGYLQIKEYKKEIENLNM